MFRNILILAICLFPFILLHATPKKKHLNIIFIGNSITEGAGLKNKRHDAPPVQTAIYLRKTGVFKSVQYANCGVSGSTTVDHLPKTKTIFDNIIKITDQLANEKWSKLVFSIMLGTNDSAIIGANKCPVSPEEYEENMGIIINTLLTKYPECCILLHAPIFYTPNTYDNAQYLQEELKRLQSDLPKLHLLVKSYNRTTPGHVFLGDTYAYEYFMKNHKTKMQAEEKNAGIFYLHPNKEGAHELGIFWGKAIEKALK